jgi:molybdenum cofactor biosynthesis enzyme
MHITSFPTRKVNDMLTSGVNISLTGAGCRYAVLVASKNLVRRITAALGALDVADGPMSQLDAARRLREAAEELEAAQVEAARKAGATWNEIGACYGLTKQGAQQRFRAARNQAKTGTAPEREKAGPTEHTRGGETLWDRASAWGGYAASGSA